MKILRRLLPYAAVGCFAVAIAAAVVWFRLSNGRERVQHWWQAWRADLTAPAAEVVRPAAFRPDALPADLRAQVTAARNDPPAAFHAFDAWRVDYARATPGPERAAMLSAGVAAAAERRAVLRELIALDPELALRLAVPRRERAQLPAPVIAELEEIVSGRGDFRVIATLAKGDGDASFRPIRREAVVNGRTYDAYVYGRRMRLAGATGIGLHGIAIDGRLALLDSPVRVLEPGEKPARGRVVSEVCAVSGLPAGPGQASSADGPLIAVDTGDRVQYLCSAGHIALLEDEQFARESGGQGGEPAQAAAAPVEGTKRVLVIRLRFADQAADFEPESAASLEATFGQADAFLRENSFGALGVQPVITPVYRLPQTAAWYQSHDTSGYALNILEAGRAIAANPAAYGQGGLTSYQYLDYDYELVRYAGGPGAFSGQAYVGSRGCWIKQPGAGVLAHELGHNLGLWHANFWEPDDPDAPLGAGRNREYGDAFDTMGSALAGALHFNTAEKAQLGWLRPGNVEDVFVSGTHRLFAHDLGGGLDPGRRYALRVSRGGDRSYWFEFRRHAGWSHNPWLQNGLGVRREAWTQSNGGTQLLDATPASTAGKSDSAIAIGHTFSDPIADVHVTPLQRSGADAIDVDVQLGPFPDNHAPTVQLTAATTQVAVGATLQFTASASDPDGDPLAYAWDFGDSSPGENAASVTHAWDTAGDRRVRVVVSDRKGLTSSASVVVRVGVAGGSRIRGRVVDLAGKPVAGVRVATALGREDVHYREALTNTDGTYTLTNVANGTWGLVATRPGWAFAPLTFADPLNVAGDATGIDFLGRFAGWRMSGVVRYANGEPVAGALVTDGTRTEPTDENGMFAFVGVPVGTHVLRVTAGGAQFSPVTVEVAYGDTIVPTISEDTFTLAGEVTGAGNEPVLVTDGWRVTTSTPVGFGATARNTFVLSGVPAGTWNLWGETSGGHFLPDTFANPLTVTGDETGLVLARQSASGAGIIRGRVLQEARGVSGAIVRAGGRWATTDARGAYALVGVPAGPQTVSVAADGLVFSPPSRDVEVGADGLSGIDFVAVHDNAPPVFVQPARASGSLDRPFVRLSARATDDGGDALVRYVWSVVGSPPAPVEFSANGARDAAQTIAHFRRAGVYRLRVTAFDATGASASSELTLTIAARPVKVAIVPANVSANIGEPVMLALEGTDQFGNTVPITADVTWSVNGGGTITRTGLFTPTTPGRGFVVTARAGTLAATAVIDVGYARGPGFGLTHEIWYGLTGGAVRHLTDAPAFPDRPNEVTEREGPLELGAAANPAINYGQRLRGFFVPPASGDYVFHIASRHASELWLSTNADPAGRILIASNPVPVGFREWGLLASQRSGAIRLTKGVGVYIEVLHKVAADQAGHLSVGVELPGGAFEGPIPGHRLLPWGARAFSPPRIVSPARATPVLIGEDLTTQLEVTATSEGGDDQLTYTWNVVGDPPGPVVFLPNGTHAARSTTARFALPGRYTLQVTVADVAQQTATSSVSVTVVQTLASWQRAHFAAAELDDPAREETRWGADADPDSDGLANLLEYAFGLDPLEPDADGAPQPGFVVVDGVRYLAITFRRNVAATDVIFTPQATSDLKTWTVGLVPVGDPDAEVVTYRDFAPAEDFDQRFLRMEVTVP